MNKISVEVPMFSSKDRVKNRSGYKVLNLTEEYIDWLGSNNSIEIDFNSTLNLHPVIINGRQGYLLLAGDSKELFKDNVELSQDVNIDES